MALIQLLITQLLIIQLLISHLLITQLLIIQLLIFPSSSWQYKASVSRVSRVTCGLTGRYVSIVIRDETKAVSLCEVEVYGVSEPTFGGTAEGSPCQLPFISEGNVVRKGCVMGGSEEGQADRPWCYTVPEEADQNWGYCQHAEGRYSLTVSL